MSSIESVLTETRIFAPHETFRQAATVSGLPAYQALCDAAEQDYTGFWAQLAQQEITWHTPFTETLDESNAPFFRWFADGKLNASYNCIDRHLEKRANKIALIFEADNGDVTNITYKELHQRVSRFANALKKQGIGLGDRVIIYLPMSIEAIIAMQACARIGAIHSVVFGGFSAKSLHERIVDVGAKLVITADGGLRGGKAVALKSAVDEALTLGGCEAVTHVIAYQRTGVDIAWNPQRDLWWHDIEAAESDYCEPTWVDAEHPLFILYTSGSTGTPKGVQHSTGGYLLGAIMSMKWVFDHKASDIFWCTADVGWITGHSYVAYGPLALGSTQVVFEGVPTYPDAGRFWQMIERHKVSIFYTAPTAIRSLIKLGGDLPNKYDLSSLRLLGTVGEPINPEAWMWYHKVVGKERCPIADTWWQTETGAHMIAPLPGAIDLKPGSCTRPLPGIIMDIVEEDGTHIEGTGGGLLVVKKPWPSMIRNIWGNEERFKKSYFPEELKGLYLAGDSAHRDEDGYFWIMGRIDDVLNVSGHRLGTMEIESALVANPLVAEAAIVGKPHEIKGESIVAYVVLKGERPEGEAAKAIATQLRDWVGKEIGPIAKPDEIRFGENLPKTRSGKIMRRLLRSLAKGEEITSDISTLDNPAILEQLKQAAG
ncbi:acetate--CoA ligase [Methylobacillus methanolivorans]|uniref:Acetyl-coenzyme A synthetase n=1 Tax=Methylobacillus methanolivorans TaxID=1848927 RepID=A0ABW8GJB9_9PROT